MKTLLNGLCFLLFTTGLSLVSQAQETCGSKSTASCCHKPAKSEKATIFPPNNLSIVRLEKSTAPLKRYFNAHQGEKRFVAVLSPSCKWCIAGATSIRKQILEAYPDQNINLSIIWTNRLKGDNYAMVQSMAAELNDARVKHFYDPAGVAGRALAKAFWGKKKVDTAWDIYLFYDQTTVWNEAFPVPSQYVHQLEPRKGQYEFLDPSRYFCGPALDNQIARLTQELFIK